MIGLVLIILFLVCACDNSKSTHYTPKYGAAPVTDLMNRYVIGIHPLHNPQRLYEVFGPLAELLTEKIEGARFEVEASRNYAAFDEKLYAGKLEFAIPNPYQTVLSLKHNYRVFGKMGDDQNFRGIILVRKDRHIETVSDLKGEVISFPAPTALAATMMPQYFLHEQGLDITTDCEVNYVGSQESSIMNVFLGNVMAGATWPPPWLALSKERPQLRDELEIKWQTDPLLNNGVVVRNDIPREIVDQVGAILFTLHETEAGRAILKPMELSQFESATDATYQSVNDFLKQFNLKIRNIDL